MTNSLKYARNCLVVCIIGLVLFLLLDKLNVHLFLNRLNSPGLDGFFLVINEGAEFAGICLALLIGVIISFRAFGTVLVALSVTSLVTQGLKHFVFHNIKRPYYHFKDLDLLNIPSGLIPHESFSMPSGHTAAAFAMCFALLLYSKDKRVWWLLTALAAAMGYARVYLSQHFLVDVFAGAMLGILFAMGSYAVFNWRSLKADAKGSA